MKKTAIIAVALAMISSTALAQSYPSKANHSYSFRSPQEDRPIRLRV